MQIIKAALVTEAANWLTNDHTFYEWTCHVMVDPSDDLILAFQHVDIEDDEEYEDAMDQLIIEVFDEARQKI